MVATGDVGWPVERWDGSLTAGLAAVELVRALPDRQRQAVVLRYVGDFSLEEISDAMGCALGTVKSTLAAARAALQLSSGDEEEADQ